MRKKVNFLPKLHLIPIEVVNYDIIYFNDLERKLKRGPIEQDGKHNYGYDNEQGEYIYTDHDHIKYRFEIIRKLGKGSFGVVLKCVDHLTKENWAVKIIRNKKKLVKQGMVEVNILEHLRDNDKDDKKNIVRIREYFKFRGHLCIVFEMLSYNLYEFIKSNHFNGFSVSLTRRFAIQILISLIYMKKLKIVHCDLKPENILLRKQNKSGIKIIDFGSSWFEPE
jgi:dual specificity tyrosine-phosphorylation-regulated kinase 2/3/4